MLALPQSDLFTTKYGRGVHSYIVATEMKKTKKKRKKTHRAGRQKKDPAFRRRRRASNKLAQNHFILGGALFGLLPDSILEGVGDSLHSAEDRYTYATSVPNIYHTVGRERVDALQTKFWEEAWEARHQQQAVRVAEKKETSRRLGESEARI